MKEKVIKKELKNDIEQDVYACNSYEDRENEAGKMVSVKIHTEDVTKEQLEATIASAQARLDKINIINEIQ